MGIVLFILLLLSLFPPMQAPKSWPNKFLINVWGGFSVIFVASYTANIAALFAGMFFERHVDVNDRSVRNGVVIHLEIIDRLVILSEIQILYSIPFRHF